jgi:hypothetical protein
LPIFAALTGIFLLYSIFGISTIKKAGVPEKYKPIICQKQKYLNPKLKRNLFVNNSILYTFVLI